jgi:hypothetical protein
VAGKLTRGLPYSQRPRSSSCSTGVEGRMNASRPSPRRLADEDRPRTQRRRPSDHRREGSVRRSGDSGRDDDLAVLDHTAHWRLPATPGISDRSLTRTAPAAPNGA